MRQEHRCAPSRQRTRPRRPAVASALCPGCPWPWQCARGHTKTWDAAPAPLSPAMPLPLWCAGEVVQRALTRAPRPGRQTAFARRSHHRHRCVGACGSGAGGVVGRAPRLRARSGETRFCGCLGNLGIVQFPEISLLRSRVSWISPTTQPHFASTQQHQQLCATPMWHHLGQPAPWGTQRYHYNV